MKERQSELEESQRKRRSGGAGQGVLSPNQCASGIMGVLARALLESARTHTGAVARGRSEHRAGRQRHEGADKGELHQYRISGLGFTPQSIWLDRDGIPRHGLGLVLWLPRAQRKRFRHCSRRRKGRRRPAQRIVRALAHRRGRSCHPQRLAYSTRATLRYAGNQRADPR